MCVDPAICCPRAAAADVDAVDALVISLPTARFPFPVAD